LLIIAIEYAIVLSLMLVAAIVLCDRSSTFWMIGTSSRNPWCQRSTASSCDHPARHRPYGFRPPQGVSLSGSTVPHHWNSGGVRDILSSSAHLALSGTLSSVDFRDTMISLGVGSGRGDLAARTAHPALCDLTGMTTRLRVRDDVDTARPLKTSA